MDRDHRGLDPALRALALAAAPRAPRRSGAIPGRGYVRDDGTFDADRWQADVDRAREVLR